MGIQNFKLSTVGPTRKWTRINYNTIVTRQNFEKKLCNSEFSVVFLKHFFAKI